MDEEHVAPAHSETGLSQKKKEAALSAAARTDLEIVVVSEASQAGRQALHETACVWTLKCDTHEAIFETETESWTQRRDGGCQRRMRREECVKAAKCVKSYRLPAIK